MEDNNYYTSEKVTVKLALASPFQRIASYIIDMILKWIITFFMLIIMLLSGVSAKHISSEWYKSTENIFILSFFMLILIFFFFYNILFENFMKGQTPGKKFLNIRVILDDGQFVTFYSVIIRNLFRIIDFLPVYYITGVLFMFLTKKNQRVGDIAAGTIVVCEERIPIPLMERKIKIDYIEAYDNLSDIIEDNIKTAIKKYVNGYKHLTKDIKNDIENTIIKHIIEKSGIQKPTDVNNYDFIVYVYKKILRLE